MADRPKETLVLPPLTDCVDECCAPPALKLPPNEHVRPRVAEGLRVKETLVLPPITDCADDACCDGADDCCDAKQSELTAMAAHADQRRVLITVLALNAAMFVVEFGAGLYAGSAALMADSVDMLGDAMVYGLSLYAIGRGQRWLAGAALFKGVFILVFGLGVLAQIGVKLTSGVPPSSGIMLIFGALALVVNLSCLALLWRFRTQDVNMSSTFECSRNDVIANVGVLVAAGGVAMFASPWPDIAVATVIAALFLRSAFNVLRRAWPQFRAA